MATTTVYLNVNDAAESISFYEGLGFKTQERHEAENGYLIYAQLDLEGAPLSLGEIAANEDPEFQEWVSTPLGSGVIVSFTLPDLAAVWEKAQATNAEVETPLTEDEQMGTYFALVDPNGYSLMFWEE